MNISRQHAKIVYNFESKAFELIVMGKNGKMDVSYIMERVSCTGLATLLASSGIASAIPPGPRLCRRSKREWSPLHAHVAASASAKPRPHLDRRQVLLLPAPPGRRACRNGPLDASVSRRPTFGDPSCGSVCRSHIGGRSRSLPPHPGDDASAAGDHFQHTPSRPFPSAAAGDALGAGTASGVCRHWQRRSL